MDASRSNILPRPLSLAYLPYNGCFHQAIASDAIIRTNSGSTTIVDEPAPATRPVLTRGPSVYQGAEEKVITEASFTYNQCRLILRNT